MVAFVHLRDFGIAIHTYVRFLDERFCALAAASQLSLVSSTPDAERRLYADLVAAKMSSVKILKTLGVGKVRVMVRSNRVHY